MTSLDSELRDNPFLACALAYARRGWQVFPLRPKKKTPLTLRGFHDATTDEQVIRNWWAKHPDAGVAIATGSRSKLLVVDIDPRNGGDETLETIELTYGELPETPTARTGGGGQHLFYKLPKGVWPGVKGLWEGIDIKADGGYVVACPSIHPETNVTYRWLISPNVPGLEDKGSELEEVPDWLLNILIQRQRSSVEKVRKDYDDTKSSIQAGDRNNALASLAGTMRRRGMQPSSIIAALLAENEVRCTPPLPDEEVRAIAESIARYEPDPEATPSGTETKSSLEFADLSKWAGGPPPEVNWLMEGLLAEGDCGIVFGPPACAKSWFAMDLALCLATDLPNLGAFTRTAADPCRVLYIDEENPPDEVWRRIWKLTKAHGLDPAGINERLKLTQPRQGFSFKSERAVAKLNRVVDAFQPHLVIMDSLTAMSNIKNESDAVEVRSFFHDKLYPIQARLDRPCTFLAIHHSNKGVYHSENPVSDAGTIRGSIDFTAAADCVFMIKPISNSSVKRFSATKVRRGLVPDPFDFEIVDAAGENGESIPGSRPMLIGPEKRQEAQREDRLRRFSPPEPSSKSRSLAQRIQAFVEADKQKTFIISDFLAEFDGSISAGKQNTADDIRNAVKKLVKEVKLIKIPGETKTSPARYQAV